MRDGTLSASESQIVTLSSAGVRQGIVRAHQGSKQDLTATALVRVISGQMSPHAVSVHHPRCKKRAYFLESVRNARRMSLLDAFLSSPKA